MSKTIRFSGVASCAICNRPLSDPESVKAGIGPICAAKAAARGAGSQPEQEAVEYVTYPPLADMFFCADQAGTRATNVPRIVTHHSPNGFAWGYGGSGPADLALNLCQVLVSRLGHRGEMVKCYDGKVYALAWDMHQDFKWAHIAPMPKAGGSIPMETLQNWVVNWVSLRGYSIA